MNLNNWNNGATFENLTRLLVTKEYYELLCDSNDEFSIVERDCPACDKSRDECEPCEVAFREKHWGKFPGTRFLKCSTCSCVWNVSVPNDQLLSHLYRYLYRAQSPGDKHFQNEFGDILLEGSTIEIGAGTNGGVMNRVRNGTYTAVSPDSNDSQTCETAKNNQKAANIVSCDVIEHMTYPADMFKFARNRMNDDSKFYFTVGQTHYENELPSDMQTTHITSFCHASIMELCSRHGLSGTQVSAAGWIATPVTSDELW